jgi:Holliday junction resolvase RusA-like endonuclease
MTSPITIFVPALPPTSNHMYIALRGGGKALSEQAMTFRALVLTDVLCNSPRPQVPDGPLALTVRLMFDNNRRSDLDNRLKAAIDAAALALRFDDSRISRITAERVGVDRGRPWCEIIIFPFVPEARAELALVGET